MSRWLRIWLIGCLVAAQVVWPAQGFAKKGIPHREVWEYALTGTAIAGVAAGVTLISINHARVEDYNLGVQAYNEGLDRNPSTFAQLQDLRNSINTGETWGWAIGAVGVAAGLGAAWFYIGDDGQSDDDEDEDDADDADDADTSDDTDDTRGADDADGAKGADAPKTLPVPHAQSAWQPPRFGVAVGPASISIFGLF